MRKRLSGTARDGDIGAHEIYASVMETASVELADPSVLRPGDEVVFIACDTDEMPIPPEERWCVWKIGTGEWDLILVDANKRYGGVFSIPRLRQRVEEGTAKLLRGSITV